MPAVRLSSSRLLMPSETATRKPAACEAQRSTKVPLRARPSDRTSARAGLARMTESSGGSRRTSVTISSSDPAPFEGGVAANAKSGAASTDGSSPAGGVACGWRESDTAARNQIAAINRRRRNPSVKRFELQVVHQPGEGCRDFSGHILKKPHRGEELMKFDAVRGLT